MASISPAQSCDMPWNITNEGGHLSCDWQHRPPPRVGNLTWQADGKLPDIEATCRLLGAPCPQTHTHTPERARTLAHQAVATVCSLESAEAAPCAVPQSTRPSSRRSSGCEGTRSQSTRCASSQLCPVSLGFGPAPPLHPTLELPFYWTRVHVRFDTCALSRLLPPPTHCVRFLSSQPLVRRVPPPPPPPRHQRQPSPDY